MKPLLLLLLLLLLPHTLSPILIFILEEGIPNTTFPRWPWPPPLTRRARSPDIRLTARSLLDRLLRAHLHARRLRTPTSKRFEHGSTL